jgi:hypothetical protein
MRALLLLAGLLSSLHGGERLYWCRIHDPASAVDFYGNATGGGRGRFGEPTELQVQNAGPEAWRFEFSANHGLWTSGGLVNAVGRAIEDRATLRPQALWHPLIRAEFQPRLLALRVEVHGASSPAGRSDLELRLELKGYNAAGEQENLQAFTVARAPLLKGPFPRRFEFPADDITDPFGLLVLLLDHAVVGDTLELGRIEAQVALPDQTPARRGMLLGLGALLANWDEASGLVQDRGSFPLGVYENVTATAKLAKLIALGIREGLIEAEAGRAAVSRIATALLNTVPRGPQPANRLWPHFTRGQGRERHPGSEWASGDTAYAAVDLALALQLTGDPRLPDALAFLREIRWDMLFDRGFYRHGYLPDGQPIPHRWEGFGVETLGINFAALAGGGPDARMLPPPTDDGSGFNLHAGYPLPPEGVDRDGHDWRRLRLEETQRQVGWYADPAHANRFLAKRGLFGLSAAETPDGQGYLAYGIGGRLDPARDGDRRVVTPHYAGLAAALAPEAAAALLENLETTGILTPLNHADVLAVDPDSGKETINWLKGSWNLSLFTEGWLFSNPANLQAARQALAAIPEFAGAWNRLFPPRQAAATGEASPTGPVPQ